MQIELFPAPAACAALDAPALLAGAAPAPDLDLGTGPVWLGFDPDLPGAVALACIDAGARGALVAALSFRGSAAELRAAAVRLRPILAAVRDAALAGSAAACPADHR